MPPGSKRSRDGSAQLAEKRLKRSAPAFKSIDSFSNLTSESTSGSGSDLASGAQPLNNVPTSTMDLNSYNRVQMTTFRNDTNSSQRLRQRKKDLVLGAQSMFLDAASLVSTQAASSSNNEVPSMFDEFGSYNPDDNGSDKINPAESADTVQHEEPRGSNDASDTGRKSKEKSNTSKRNRMKAALEGWLPNRSSVLDEMLRSEGCGDGSFEDCSICHGPQSHYKCEECFGNFLYCRDCILKNHTRLPLHRVQFYNNAYFERKSLRDIGLRIQLGHENGQICYRKLAGPKDFTVVHANGIHHVNIDFCDCGHSDGGHRRYTQLLRVQWFPATTELPSTVITFDCLDLYLEMSHASKINTYDFYTALARRTDNTGRESTSSRYHEFSLVSRLWKHCTMLKRAGRGHDPAGVDSTKEGALSVLCPACPQPEYNLPPDWMDRAKVKSFLFTLFLSIDANFKLSQKERGFQDVELAPGWAYFVEENKFKSVIKDNSPEIESNTCRSMHNALLHATTRNGKGYAVTGVGAVVCGRHSFVRPNGVGDLQKGEKYVNMDYIALCTLMGATFYSLFFTYDIACQWSKNFIKRQQSYPEAMRLPKDTSIRYAIPSFHIHGHGDKCQTSFSLNLLPGVGRTYGEGIESQWAQINAVGTSTREQASGMRHESLIDQWGAHNWQRTLNFGSHLKKCLEEAVAQYSELKVVFEEFSATFEKKDLVEWEDQIVSWEDDPMKKNPYAETENSVTFNDVKRELADEEAALLRGGLVPTHKMSVSTFLIEGLELEEQQRGLLMRDHTRDHQINKKTVSLQERRNALWTDIAIWRRNGQDVHMPIGASLRVSPDDPLTMDAEENIRVAESLPLCLPSSVPVHLCSGNIVQLRDLERRLRLAQAEDALNEIRRHRRTLTGVSIFKKCNVSGTGQKNNTRARDCYERFVKLCDRAAARYRAARSALQALDPNGDWTGRLKELRDADVSGPHRDVEHNPSEGRYEVSWIWRIPGCNMTVSEDSPEFSENMRVEWSRARARQLRWREEIELLVEEMRRVVAFLERRSEWWKEQGRLRMTHTPSLVSGSISSGLTMYAEKQSAYMINIAGRFAVLWRPIFIEYGIPDDFLASFIDKRCVEIPTAVNKGKEKKVYDVSAIFMPM